MTIKSVICAVVLLLPAVVFAQGVPVENDTTSGSAGESTGATVQADTSKPTSDVPSETVSAESGDEPTSQATSEQDGEETEKEPAETLPVLNEDDTFLMRLTLGHRRLIQSDFPGALYVYESAKNMEPSRAETYIYISYTLGKLMRYEDAVVVLSPVSSLVENKDDPTRAKALFARAVIEEMRGPSEAVKEGWMAYEQYARTHEAGVMFVSTAKERLAALEKMRELDEKYQIVRERIAKGNQ